MRGRRGRLAWNKLAPFLDLAPEIREVVDTTNTIESINYQLRKVSKTRPVSNDEAVFKIRYLAVCDIETRDTSRGGDARKKKHPGPRLRHARLNSSPQPARNMFPGKLTNQLETGSSGLTV